MRANFIVHRHIHAAHEWADHHHHALGLLLAVLVAILTAAVAWSTVDVLRSAWSEGDANVVAEASESVLQFESRPLPQEWSRWDIGLDAQQLDQRIYNRPPPPSRPDWIAGQ